MWKHRPVGLSSFKGLVVLEIFLTTNTLVCISAWVPAQWWYTYLSSTVQHDIILGLAMHPGGILHLSVPTSYQGFGTHSYILSFYNLTQHSLFLYFSHLFNSLSPYYHLRKSLSLQLILLSREGEHERREGWMDRHPSCSTYLSSFFFSRIPVLLALLL